MRSDVLESCEVWAGSLVGLFTCLCEWDPRVWCSYFWTLQLWQLQSFVLDLCCVNLVFLLIDCEPQIRYLLFLLRCSWSREVRPGAFSSSAWISDRGRGFLLFNAWVTLVLPWICYSCITLVGYSVLRTRVVCPCWGCDWPWGLGVYEYTHDIVSVICMFAMSSGCRWGRPRTAQVWVMFLAYRIVLCYYDLISVIFR